MESNRNEKIEQMKKLLVEMQSAVSEERSVEICLLIGEISPDPYWSDYIFQTNEYLNKDKSINFDKFFRKVFSYQAIQL